MDLSLIFGTVIALLSILVSVLIYRAQKRRKIIEYALVAQTPLVIADAPSSLELRFNSEAVEDVRLLTVAVANLGTDSIATRDFEDRPLEVRLAGTGERSPRILSAEVRDPRPKALKPSLVVDGCVVQIEPLILNVGDSFGIQMLTAGGEANVSMDGRVVGVSNIRRFDPESKGPVVWVIGVGWVFTVCPPAVLIVDFGGDLQWALWLALYLLGASAFLVAAWRSRKRKRYTRRFFES